MLFNEWINQWTNALWCWWNEKKNKQTNKNHHHLGNNPIITMFDWLNTMNEWMNGSCKTKYEMEMETNHIHLSISIDIRYIGAQIRNQIIEFTTYIWGRINYFPIYVQNNDINRLPYYFHFISFLIPSSLSSLFFLKEKLSDDDPINPNNIIHPHRIKKWKSKFFFSSFNYYNGQVFSIKHWCQLSFFSLVLSSSCYFFLLFNFLSLSLCVYVFREQTKNNCPSCLLVGNCWELNFN